MRLYAVRARLTLYEGYLSTLRLQVSEGRVLLLAGLAEARACRDISVLIGHCVIATMDGCDGRFSEAFAELAEAERLMHIWDVPPVYYLAMITLVKCELWLLQGRSDLAEAWLLRLTQTYNGGLGVAAPECHPQLPQHIELQRAVLERTQGDSVTSEQRLQALEQRARCVGAQLLELIAMTQQIDLLLGQSRLDEARGLLLRCLHAAAGGALLPFRTLLGEHAQWLHEQLLQAPHCKVRNALLEKFPACFIPLTPEPAHGSDCLSVRELGVLQLIAKGCSNQEISEQLFISLHTVKTHASHINSKLGVERRTQAVARAKILGLLG
ncbi:Regulatory protein, LuxR [Pseudomonas coronafaciens pv. atropurpurea]|nr:Regulatory protein, LuxR [Pseudomonas coronafaciens pv. atropurpurea]